MQSHLGFRAERKGGVKEQQRWGYLAIIKRKSSYRGGRKPEEVRRVGMPV